MTRHGIRQLLGFFLQDHPSILRHSRLTYAQCGEDILLGHIFHDKAAGFFVDVGAYHPFIFSNTYLLYKRGWRGINIEPNPTQFPLFPKHRPRDINLQCAVTDQPGTKTLIVDSTFSGLDDDTNLYRKRNPSAPRVQVPAMTLRELFATHMPSGTTIDVMSIDCEGHEIKVLQSNDWSDYAPSVLVVEDHDNRTPTPLDEYLNGIGNDNLYKAGFSKIYRRR
jgi:FkbM family methyltransferase